VLQDGTIKITKGNIITKQFTQFPGAYDRAMAERDARNGKAHDEVQGKFA
jgi:hypothetical protein